MGRRRWVAVVVACLLTALVASSCARPVETNEVSVESKNGGAKLATSTTMANGRASGGSATASNAAAGEPELAGTASDLLARIAGDPTLAAQLAGGDLSALSELTGLSTTQLAEVGITPATVRSLAAVLSAGGGLDGSAASLAGIPSQAIATLLGQASTVDPKVTEALGVVLTTVDPDGLGRLATDRNSLALVAVLFAAALRMDPSQLGNLANAQAAEPGLTAAIQGIEALASSLSPQAVATLNALRERFSPEVIELLSGLLVALGDPKIAPVITEAAGDPVVVATTLGVAGLLIPGLAEALDPTLVGVDPRARYTALLGLIALAAANESALDISALAAALAALGLI